MTTPAQSFEGRRRMPSGGLDLAFGGFSRCRGLPRRQIEFLAALVRLDDDLLGFERILQNGNAQLGLGIATHEHVKRGVVSFGPAMNGNVALSKNRNSGYTAVRCEMMQMNMQQARSGDLDTPLQGSLHVLDIVEPVSAKQIDDQMIAGIANAIAFYEEVVSLTGRRRRRIAIVRYPRVFTMIFLLGGA